MPINNFEYNIDDYFTCPITLQFIDEPVMTIAGITYEKEAIEQHFKKNNFEPSTKDDLNGRKEKIKNIALKSLYKEITKSAENLQYDAADDVYSVMNISLTHGDIPKQFLCLRSKQVMFDPVTTVVGNTYEREVIEDWFKNNNSTDPISGTILEDKSLIPNFALRKIIGDYLSQNKDLYFKTIKIDGIEKSLVYLSKNYINTLKNSIIKIDIGEFRNLINKDPRSLTLIIHDNYSTFHYIAEHGDVKILVYFLKVADDREILDEIAEQNKPIHWKPTVLNNCLYEFVTKNFEKIKIEYDLDVEWQPQEIIDTLILLNADKKIKDANNIPLIHAAILHNQNADLINHLCILGLDLYERDGQFGWTPLQHATDKNNHEIVQWLLLAMPETEKFRKVLTEALFIAVKNDANFIAEMLLSNGAFATAYNNDTEQNSPLHIAAENGSLEMFRLLCRYGADLELINKGNFTPISLAISKGYTEIIKFILNCREFYNLPNAPFLLHDAIRHNKPDIFQLLANSKLNLDAKNGYFDYTPLHIAAINRDANISECLISKGANYNLKDNNGQTPLELVETEYDILRKLPFKSAAEMKEMHKLEVFINNLKKDIEESEKHKLCQSITQEVDSSTKHAFDNLVHIVFEQRSKIEELNHEIKQIHLKSCLPNDNAEEPKRLSNAANHANVHPVLPPRPNSHKFSLRKSYEDLPQNSGSNFSSSKANICEDETQPLIKVSKSRFSLFKSHKNKDGTRQKSRKPSKEKIHNNNILRL